MLASLPNTEPLIVRTPPLLCIEILSSKDRLPRVRQRLDDYAGLGVKSMWVIDPWRRTAFSAGPDAALQEQAQTLAVEGTGISITVPDIFTELARLERRAAGK